MAKFYGKVGFSIVSETSPDVWEPVETVRYYCGDFNRVQRRWENGQSVNEDLAVSNEISLIMDDFIQGNAGAVKWIEAMGSKWKVNSVTINYPRIVFTIGGVYNGG